MGVKAVACIKSHSLESKQSMVSSRNFCVISDGFEATSSFAVRDVPTLNLAAASSFSNDWTCSVFGVRLVTDSTGSWLCRIGGVWGIRGLVSIGAGLGEPVGLPAIMSDSGAGLGLGVRLKGILDSTEFP